MGVVLGLKTQILNARAHLFSACCYILGWYFAVCLLSILKQNFCIVSFFGGSPGVMVGGLG